MELFNSLLKDHLSKWALVWFGFLFWGSIFSAFLIMFFQNISHSYLYVLGYFLGIIFGIFSKINKWSWIN
ncbi:MAG: hypothetical protein CMK55_04440 [Proteobacteria bacterium]|nr:hypothetical protein [Pseudomonadota bacterium]|tara:strand:+ start:1921 stop:2130 length:210 start_codon:yes stop_codon:yes gene_type:complete